MTATLYAETLYAETLAAPQSGTLFGQAPSRACIASVIIPARNEEAALPATLDALRRQMQLDGSPLAFDSYEVLLLLNNCSDASASVAARYQASWPEFPLHVAECRLPAERAHVGTARCMLMDAACDRMEQADRGFAILSTDADTHVAPDWIAANLAELAQGADVVGGLIHLLPADFDSLEPGIRLAYERDRRYQELVAELESVLDPDPCDPWPRHLQHFGASLACTCEIYRRSGGLPPVKPLEDVAFIDALRRVGARIRHAPSVSITTSARLDGRAEIGLSGQLRHWQNDVATGAVHEVDSAEWLIYRFRTLGILRATYERGSIEPESLPGSLRAPLELALGERLSAAGFLDKIDCDRLIDASFKGIRRGEIGEVIAKLEARRDSFSPA